MKIVLGVTGSIAAYKSGDLVRRFIERGDEVQVVLTRTAREFVAPLALAVLSRRPVHESLFGDHASSVDHVDLARWADVLIVAPATAEVLAKLAHGFADDFLSTYALAHHKPLLIAPAMESAMWAHPAVAANAEVLRSRGARFVGPNSGFLASGGDGPGRMAEPAEVLEAAVSLVEGKHDLEGVRVLVSAGPTREAIDPIRFVSNRSSGRMGFELAEKARARGARVTLLLGGGSVPTSSDARGMTVHRFESSSDLQALLEREFESCDVLVMAAAVADFIPEKLGRRIHRSEGPRSLSLAPGEDLLASLAPRKGNRLVVAFAAESGDGQEERARQKLASKKADWIVWNDVSAPGIGFESPDNEVVLLSSAGKRIEIDRRSKADVAEKIWDAVSSTLSWKTIPERA
ncbi:MAG: bifunctional phosphopantothenoylcysteine decarboxylase/phosphopantothenate--cysteine ligase CoaBC [Thermoanaerobaculia bacterium]